MEADKAALFEEKQAAEQEKAGLRDELVRVEQEKLDLDSDKSGVQVRAPGGVRAHRGGAASRAEERRSHL